MEIKSFSYSCLFNFPIIRPRWLGKLTGNIFWSDPFGLLSLLAWRFHFCSSVVICSSNFVKVPWHSPLTRLIWTSTRHFRAFHCVRFLMVRKIGIWVSGTLVMSVTNESMIIWLKFHSSPELVTLASCAMLKSIARVISPTFYQNSEPTVKPSWKIVHGMAKISSVVKDFDRSPQKPEFATQ